MCIDNSGTAMQEEQEGTWEIALVGIVQLWKVFIFVWLCGGSCAHFGMCTLCTLWVVVLVCTFWEVGASESC